MALSYEKPIIGGRLVCRENRFIARCEFGGDEHTVYVPNTGRMIELMIPGNAVWLVDHGSATTRKQRYSLAAAALRGTPVLVDAGRTNDIVAALLERREIPQLCDYRVVAREVPCGHSRIDFLLARHDNPAQTLLLEVKSCTFVANGRAMFPDAVSQRGERHLSALADAGTPAAVLFVVMLPDATSFTPHFHVDPAFSRTLCDLSGTLQIIAVRLAVDDTLTLRGPAAAVPIDLASAEQHNRDQGAYALHCELTEPRRIAVGALGELDFAAGHYVYLGSAKRNLQARIDRHRRRNKRPHWHIDALLAHAPVRAVWAVRGYGDEQRLASTLMPLADRLVPQFGATDSPLPSHLCYFRDPPLSRRAVVEWVMNAWTAIPG